MRSFLNLYRRSFIFRAVTGFAAAAALLVLLGFFVVDSHLIIPHFDDAIRSFVFSRSSQMLTTVLRGFTQVGSTIGLTVIGVALIGIFLYMRRLDYIGLFLLAMAGQI